MSKMQSYLSQLRKTSATSSLIVALALLSPSTESFAESINTNTLLAKAAPDECFFAPGDTKNTFPATLPCPNGATPKVNQAYVWGLAKSGQKLFFGTVANVPCLVVGGMIFNMNTPIQTPSYVCEFKASKFNGTDWRPPKLFIYDLVQRKTIDVSTPANAGLTQTLGIRSAGSLGNIVFLGGPTLDGKGIYLFAFRGDGVFIGAKKLTEYDDIRQWIVLDGKLYTGVRVSSDKTGRVLRWRGSSTNPFVFEEVGVTDSEVSYLASLNGRLYATTWGGGNSGPVGPASGLWVSPQVPSPAIGLTKPNATQWKKLWDVGQYEVDPVTAQTLVGGALVAYQDKIYWGLMQVPLTGLLAHRSACPSAPTDPLATVQAIVSTTRPAPMFRIDGDAATNPAKQAALLYGSPVLAKYDCAAKSWSYVPNKAANPTPLMGRAGFGNPFNTYVWAGSVFKNRAYFGTFDWSYLLADGVTAIAQANNLQLPPGFNIDQLMQAFNKSPSYPDGLPAPHDGLQSPLKYGADLWRFDNTSGPAVAESIDGLGNRLNYGIRTLLSDVDRLYVGTANPMNLKTAPGQPNGGWELRALTPAPLPDGTPLLQ